MKLVLPLFLWLLLGQICCTSQPPMPVLTVVKTVMLPELPSGSGLAISRDTLYVVGDDTPYLYSISPDFKLFYRQLLMPQHAAKDRITKQLKPDLESLTLVNWYGESALMAFGSGSKSPERDSLLVISLEGKREVISFSLTPFYDTLCQAAGISREALNIEGAVQLGEHLWLLNRGQNSITSVPMAAFVEFLLGKAPAAEIPLQAYSLQLPLLGGKQARFSGACAIPGTRQVLFTATVEDTNNWIDDGEILGSFVGILNESHLQTGRTQHAWLLKNDAGEILKEKLESVDVLQRDEDGLKIVAVADNDDGSSRMFELALNGLGNILQPLNP